MGWALPCIGSDTECRGFGLNKQSYLCPTFMDSPRYDKKPLLNAALKLVITSGKDTYYLCSYCYVDVTYTIGQDDYFPEIATEVNF